MIYFMETLGVVALILGGCALGVAVLYDSTPEINIVYPEHIWDGTSLSFMNPNGTWSNPVNLKGDTGERGPTGSSGSQGSTGAKGDIGLSPNHMWNGTRLRFQNSNGSWGNYTNLKGVNGTKGLHGINGTDYINHLPTLDVIANTGTYIMSPDNSSMTRFKYLLKIVVDDIDDDMVQTKVFYRFNISDVWIEGNIFFDTDMNLSANKYIDLLVPVNTTIFWCVQLWDGCDIIMDYIDCTVEYI